MTVPHNAFFHISRDPVLYRNMKRFFTILKNMLNFPGMEVHRNQGRLWFVWSSVLAGAVRHLWQGSIRAGAASGWPVASVSSLYHSVLVALALLITLRVHVSILFGPYFGPNIKEIILTIFSRGNSHSVVRGEKWHPLFEQIKLI